MDENFNDTFDYSDIIPLNYKSKTALISEFDEIYKNTENTKIDWRRRELALKKISRICIGNQGKSETFLQFFNGQIYPNLDIQLADLRSSLMKEACRIVSFCAKELGLLIETSMAHMMTQHVLFKIAGNSNKVISENSSRCVLNIVKYVHSVKIITNICEQKILKANNVRVLVAQCIYIIICMYKYNLIQKTLGIILETIKSLLSDASAEVRASTRKDFIAYKKRFPNESNNFFEELDKSVQKQINEDEKSFWNIIEIKVDDSSYKNNNINLNNSNNVKKAFSNQIGSHSIHNSNKKSNNSIKNNESLNHKSSLNITPIKAKKSKALYTSNLKQKFHEAKFNQKNYGNSNENNIKNNNKNKINNAINRTAIKEIKKEKEKDISNYNNKEELNANNNNTNNEEKEFVFTNLNLLRRAKLENSLKNKSQKNPTNKKKINKNLYQSPKKINIVESSPPKNIKPKEISNKLKNSLKEKNLNDLKISSKEIFYENKTQTEEKLLILIKKLDESKNDSDKLLVFQYIYNDFKQILKEINYFSEVSIRKFIDKHIEYLNNEDKGIVSQVIKNLMRMIYYMKNVFNKYDIEIIIKSMLIELKKLKTINTNKNDNNKSDNNENNNEIEVVENKSNEEQNKEQNIEDNSLYKLIFQLYEIIIRKYEHEELIKMFFSIIKENKNLDNPDNNKELDYDTCFDWLTKLISSEPNILEILNNFKKYFKILLSSLDLNSSNKSLEFIDYLYKSFNENFISAFKEETEENAKKLLSLLEQNQSPYYQELLNMNKLKSTRKNSDAKLNNTNNNSAEEDFEELPKEILTCIESNDITGFKSYLEKNKNLIPSFLLILSDNEYTEIKYIENLINFTYALISSNDDIFLPDLEQCIELFINQVIHILLTNKKNQNIIKISSDILIMTPMKLNSEKFFKTISQYLTNKNDEILLKTLLQSIKNFVLDNKTKNLEKVLPYFAENLLGLINHTSKEIKEEAVFCCVEIIMVVGYKFDKYLELLPKSQQNLINFFIKKRTG